MKVSARTIGWDALVREALMRRCGHREIFYLRAPSDPAYRWEVAQVLCARCRPRGRTPQEIVNASGNLQYPKTRKEGPHADADS